MTTTQICVASTLYGAATLAAAVDAGQLGTPDRRVLLTSNNAVIPEVTPEIPAMPGSAELRTRFLQTHSWNEVIRPLHPSSWNPRESDCPLWERYLRDLWNLGDDDIELVIESIQVPPAIALARIFVDAAVVLYADGLMSYGPTRSVLPPLVATGIRRVLYLDLIPGLEPLLLSEAGAVAEPISTAAFRGVLGELAAAAAVDENLPRGAALILGQPLTALELLSEAEEAQLHLALLDGVIDMGFTEVVFKPHPTALPGLNEELSERAGERGARLTVVDVPMLAEVLYQKLQPGIVVGCYSTGLFTAARFFGIPVARLGTSTVLSRLRPYPNSNRIPVVLADAVLPDLGKPDRVRAWTPPDPDRTRRELTPLLTTVGYTMQPQNCQHLREQAIADLDSERGQESAKYLTSTRLAVLGLPGARVDLSKVVGDPTVKRVLKTSLARATVRFVRKLARR